MSTTFGRQVSDQFLYSATKKAWGLVYKPIGFDPAQKYPLIINLHGRGEWGTSESSLANLNHTGLCQLISLGMDIPFIVISPQKFEAWSFVRNELEYILPDIIAKYGDNIDQSRIYLAGLSAGATGALSCLAIDKSFAQKFAAVVAISSAGANNDQDKADYAINGAYGVPIWFIGGDVDVRWKLSLEIAKMINNFRSSFPNLSYVSTTPIKGADHTPAAWNTAFDLKWKDNPNNPYKRTIYDWMLQYSVGGVVNPNPQPQPTPKTLIATIKVYSDGSIEKI